MDKKQKEDLVIALLEKGETYREITKRAGVSPNTIKAVANKMGLDQNYFSLIQSIRIICQAKDSIGSCDCIRPQG